MRLFYNTPFSSIEEEVWATILTRLKASSIETAHIDLIAKNLIEQNKINLPVLKADSEIKSSLELEDENGKIYQPTPNAQYPNPTVVATAKFVISFTGDERFFDVRPSQHIEVGYPATSGYKSLIIKIRTKYVNLPLSDKWKEFIRREIKAVKENVNQNLGKLQNDVIGFEESLPEKIKSYIENKRVEIADKKKIDNEINPFI